MTIYLKQEYNILGQCTFDRKMDVFQFKVFDENTPIVLQINTSNNTLNVFMDIDYVERESSAQEIENINKTVVTFFGSMSNAAYKLMSAIKYGFNEPSLSEQLLGLKSSTWSLDNNKWVEVQQQFTVKPGIWISRLTLHSETAPLIQEYLDDNFEPFIALKHLHRAFMIGTPRYTWIEATIAAELAIKEFYSIFKPEIEVIILELPSPPIGKLYGVILEHYTGKRSPYYKKLQEGYEIRNKLVHRPAKIEVTYEETFKYLSTVEGAIFHLLQLLYPNDKIIENIVTRTNKINGLE